MKKNFTSIALTMSTVFLFIFAACGSEPPKYADCTSGLKAGDLIITEFFPNPKGSNKYKQYVEIYNPGTQNIDLTGVRFFWNKGTTTKQAWVFEGDNAVVKPGQYFVFGDYETPAVLPSYLDYAFTQEFKMPSSGIGTIGLHCNSVVIHEVTYDSSLFKEAFAIVRSGDNALNSDDSETWCQVPKADTYLLSAISTDGTDEEGESTQADSEDSEVLSQNYGAPKKANPTCAPESPLVLPSCTAALNPGDFYINEVMVNPSGADAFKEYIEIYNPGNASLSLNGLKIFRRKLDGTAESAKWSILSGTLPSKSYFVVGDYSERPLPAHLDYGIPYELGLPNSSGQIGFYCNDIVIDLMKYNTTTDGTSLSLLTGLTSPYEENDDPINWSPTPKQPEYEIPTLSENYGTPGSENAAMPKCFLGQGAFIITEIMANPKGADTNQEYVEIYNPGNVSIDLGGVTFFKKTLAGTETAKWTFSEGAIVQPGSYFVMGDTADPSQLPGYLDYGFSTALALPNSSAQIGFYCGKTIIDMAEYPDPKEGFSLSLNPLFLTVTGNDDPTNWCNTPKEDDYIIAGTMDTNGNSTLNYGTPGSENPSCTSQPIGSCLDEGKCRDISSGNCRDIEIPTAADVVISEIMGNTPASAPGLNYKYVELYARNTFDLNTVYIGKSNDSDASPADTEINSEQCITVQAGEYFVIARSADSSINGGLPKVDFVYSAFSPNQSGYVYLSKEAKGVDRIIEIQYGKGTQYHSQQLSSDKLNSGQVSYCQSTDTYATTIDDVSLYGTPGNANTLCP